MWQVGDIAVCVKACKKSAYIAGTCDIPVGSVHRVTQVTGSGNVVVLVFDWMSPSKHTYKGVRAERFRKIQKADDKFCEQMKQLTKGKIDA